MKIVALMLGKKCDIEQNLCKTGVSNIKILKKLGTPILDKGFRNRAVGRSENLKLGRVVIWRA